MKPRNVSYGMAACYNALSGVLSPNNSEVIKALNAIP